jgi:hypothetical protein
MYADKSCTCRVLKQSLKEQGIELITSVHKNMKKEDLSDFDRVILRKRTLIEIAFGQLKSISQIEHSRHRSLLGFMVNALAGLIA